MPHIAPRSAATVNADASYRMLWRWHFYAGLFVMPFLIVLAVTGTLYCFQPQIEPLLYPHLLKVEPAGERLPAQQLLGRAREAARRRGDGHQLHAQYRSPGRAPSSCSACLRAAATSVYLNPYTGAYLGSLSVEDRFMKQVRNAPPGLARRQAGRIADGTGGMLGAGDDRHGPGDVVAAPAPARRARLRAGPRHGIARRVEGNPSRAGRMAGRGCPGIHPARACRGRPRGASSSRRSPRPPISGGQPMARATCTRMPRLRPPAPIMRSTTTRWNPCRWRTCPGPSA